MLDCMLKMCDIILYMKKIFYFLCAVFMAASVVNLSGVVDNYVFAEGTCDDRYFLFLKPWDFGLEHDSNCNVTAFGDKITPDDKDSVGPIWTVILNIAYDLFAIVGVIAAGFIIYAGYGFLTSGGDPGKAAKARKSLASSIAGILVALSSSVLVNTISDFIKPSKDASEVLNGGFNLAYAVCGIIATAFIIYGGFMYLTSTGDPGKVRKGRQTLIYSIIGLLVVLLAWAITNFVIGAIE